MSALQGNDYTQCIVVLLTSTLTSIADLIYYWRSANKQSSQQHFIHCPPIYLCLVSPTDETTQSTLITFDRYYRPSYTLVVHSEELAPRTLGCLATGKTSQDRN